MIDYKYPHVEVWGHLSPAGGEIYRADRVHVNGEPWAVVGVTIELDKDDTIIVLRARGSLVVHPAGELPPEQA